MLEEIIGIRVGTVKLNVSQNTFEVQQSQADEVISMTSHVILMDQKYALQFEYGLGKAAA